ncbi:MAG TPA: YicC/YloC family endoribonuclease, partial [Gemmatimonadales bacterium]|nr:YicC/YloC family endoribonuclease [Gemmatimonadales bacterium]
MPNSMTGFGAAEGPAGGGRLRVEIRTVNHRYFNLAPKLPGELSALEGDLRERLRREFDRGHVAVQARWTETPERGGGFA